MGCHVPFSEKIILGIIIFSATPLEIDQNFSSSIKDKSLCSTERLQSSRKCHTSAINLL